MPYTSGTAANYKDLLAVMATFAAANGWVVLEQSETKVYLKGTGLAGLDEIYCGVETYEDPPNNRYNWQMVGSWGYRAGRTLSKHPVSSNAAGTNLVVGYLWNSPIPYWMVANGRRIIVCAKIGTTYQQMHLGLLTVPATDAQYPYPLLIGGSGNSLAQNSSGTLYSFWANTPYSVSRLSCPGGSWGSHYVGNDFSPNPYWKATTFNVSNISSMVTSPDGSYLLEPIYLEAYSYGNIFGQIEGLYRVTGFNNTAENIITVEGVNYMVFPDGSRSGYGDYCALRLN
jgi:hypothetical protein